MVNTFVTHWPLQETFKRLDNARLGKQRVEAYQILNLITDVHRIAEHLALPRMPDDEYARPAWFKSIYAAYKKVPKDQRLRVTSYTGKERIISGGFSSHPVALMWIGYEEGLKEYINLCIEEWIKRGFKNTMEMYEHSCDISEVTYPWWIRSYVVHLSHQASLYRKNMIHYEKPDDKWVKKGYCWPVHLSQEIQEHLRNGTKEYEPEEVCCEVTTKGWV